MNMPARSIALYAAGLAGVAALGVLFRFVPVPKPPDRPAPIAGAPAPAPADGPMHIAPEELSAAGWTRDDNVLRMRLRWCPPGSFRMGRLGAPLARFGSIEPVRVEVRRGFWMGQSEVTQAQWFQMMQSTLREQRAKDPGQPRPLGDGSTRDHAGEGDDRPIYFVSQADAEEFCRRLTEHERQVARLEPGREYRLPTEAQWEWACRAGTTTATAFGDGLDSSRANFDGGRPFDGSEAGPYLREVTPAGRFPANAWGLQDMHGNVWEWCRDGYSDRPPGGVDPMVAATTARRLYRGGCWHNPGSLCLSTSRAWGEVGDRGSGLGFRVALVSTGP